MDQEQLQTLIDLTKTQITQYMSAITAISSGTVARYTIDTGQTRMEVTKKNLSSIENALDAALNRQAVLEARLAGAAGQLRPGW